MSGYRKGVAGVRLCHVPGCNWPSPCSMHGMRATKRSDAPHNLVASHAWELDEKCKRCGYNKCAPSCTPPLAYDSRVDLGERVEMPKEIHERRPTTADKVRQILSLKKEHAYLQEAFERRCARTREEAREQIRAYHEHVPVAWKDNGTGLQPMTYEQYTGQRPPLATPKTFGRDPATYGYATEVSGGAINPGDPVRWAGGFVHPFSKPGRWRGGVDE